MTPVVDDLSPAVEYFQVIDDADPAAFDIENVVAPISIGSKTIRDIDPSLIADQLQVQRIGCRACVLGLARHDILHGRSWSTERGWAVRATKIVGRRPAPLDDIAAAANIERQRGACRHLQIRPGVDGRGWHQCYSYESGIGKTGILIISDHGI